MSARKAGGLQSSWCLLQIVAALLTIAATLQNALCEERGSNAPVRIAVYDVAPYGSVAPNGELRGASVDLWRRVAGDLGWDYKLTSVSQMESILAGLEQGRFDAAIGAITITPEREARVDFSYPAHGSGVAVALRKNTGLLAAIVSYISAVAELGYLVVGMLALLLLLGFLIWLVERPGKSAAEPDEDRVNSFRDGLYWAVVTMTTVGYGDKTPKTATGRIVAIVWMLGSIALVSLMSASLVSRMTAERMDNSGAITETDLSGKKLAAVAFSSGAEFLDNLRIKYDKYSDLQEALSSLADGRSDAVINSVGALQYLVGARFNKVIYVQRPLLAPAFMAIALPEHSPLKKPIDRALMKITASPEWKAVEDVYFGRGQGAGASGF
jgi:ABC-type amino acid transport substrate-binding protein